MDPLTPNLIRLLHIGRGTEQEICCRLSQADLNFKPVYEALSYVWGASDKSRKIYCDEKELQITQNLYEALQQLRLPDRERVIWIDALCINQNDIPERSAQVRIMSRIYAQAHHVFVWLGKDSETDTLAYEMLQRFKRAFSKDSTYEYNINTNTETQTLPTAFNPDWTALVKLFQRAWFSRVWVIQEVVKAKEVSVAFGPMSESWELIVKVSRACQKTGYMGSYTIKDDAPGSQSAIIIDLLKLPKQEITLMELLRLTRHYNASDKRDKVFALMGIATDGDDTGVTIDYTLTVEEIFQSLAVHSLVEKKSLACLSSAGLSSVYPNSEMLTLPSWVPDWTHDNDRVSALGICSGFSAGGSTTPIVKISSDKTTLDISGYLIDTISLMSYGVHEDEGPKVNPLNETNQEKRMLRWKRALENCDKMIAEAFSHPAGQDSEEALWQTVCCGLSPSGARAPETYRDAFKVWRVAFRATDDKGKTNMHKQFFAKDVADSREFGNAVVMFALGRKFCITDKGYMGRVPNRSRKGDRICVLKGGRVPFVIRGTANGQYQLVGECYIHGIMKGEVLEQKDIGTLEDIKII